MEVKPKFIKKQWVWFWAGTDNSMKKVKCYLPILLWPAGTDMKIIMDYYMKLWKL